MRGSSADVDHEEARHGDAGVANARAGGPCRRRRAGRAALGRTHDAARLERAQLVEVDEFVVEGDHVDVVGEVVEGGASFGAPSTATSQVATAESSTAAASTCSDTPTSWATSPIMRASWPGAHDADADARSRLGVGLTRPVTLPVAERGAPCTSPSNSTSDGPWTRPSRAPTELRERGFNAMWSSQIFGPDTLTVLAVVGREVRDVDLGTAVVPIQPRHPRDARGPGPHGPRGHRRAGSRWASGLSHQSMVEGMWGLSFERPASYMREYLDALAPMLRGEAVASKGERVTSTAVGAGRTARGAHPGPAGRRAGTQDARDGRAS